MARRRASMREGPLAELFKATESAQRQAERERAGQESAEAPTVEHAAPEQSGPPAPPAEAEREPEREALTSSSEATVVEPVAPPSETTRSEPAPQRTSPAPVERGF
jgi:hypothetical protein